jgi:hypothetical protein
VSCGAEKNTVNSTIVIWSPWGRGGDAGANAICAVTVPAVGSVMGEIINLRKVRKQARKQQDTERAAANRLLFGRSKTERVGQANRTAELNRRLDGHKIDSGDVE